LSTTYASESSPAFFVRAARDRGIEGSRVVSSSASSSAGATCMPLYLISSFVRSTMKNHPFVVHVADVASVIPAFAVDRVSRVFGLTEVALHDLRASH